MNRVKDLLHRKPKYIILADMFREQISSGEIPKNTRLQPDKVLASKYQVNTRTIASSLNMLVSEGLLERAPGRGTIVIKDIKATTNTVGMVMLSEGDVYSDIARNIAKGFKEYNLIPNLINNNIVLDYSCVINFLNSFIAEKTRPYGLIIDGSFNFPYEFLKQNIDKFHNVVFINKYHHPEKISEAKYALVDLAEAGRLAAKHFIAQGYKKLTCLAMHEKEYAGPWSSMQVQIMQGFAEVCKENNVQFNEEVFWKLLHGASFAETVNTLLSGADCPDAIFSYNDALVRNKLLPFLENHKDIDLIGFYNTSHADECGFSSICIHEEKIAENAIALLTGNSSQKEILIKPKLVIRSR